MLYRVVNSACHSVPYSSSNGYKHLVDSSLDWSQNLPALKNWLDEEAKHFWQQLGKKSSLLMSPSKLDFYIRLSFGRLYSFLWQREPDDHVGYSILIYRLSDKEVARALLGSPPELLADRTGNLRFC